VLPDGLHALRTLYDANHERVRRVLARLVGPQEAEDLTQTVFAKAAKALPTFRGDADASTWRLTTFAALGPDLSPASVLRP
jgi:RNA polymerase sigma-70 factor, ECF subfamily